MRGLRLSSHALERLRARGIPPEAVRLAVQLGTPRLCTFGTPSVIYEVREGDCRRHPELRPWLGLRVVVDHRQGRGVVTAYRQRRIVFRPRRAG